MYIDFYFEFNGGKIIPEKASFALNGSDYSVKFPVNSKETGHEGSLFFTKDESGSGSIEWCRGNNSENTGEKISLEDLIKLLEARGGN